MENNQDALDREEVLARSRKENAQGDERLRQVLEKAEGYGFAGSAVAVILVGIIRQRDAWQAILWSAAALAELAVYATRLGMG